MNIFAQIIQRLKGDPLTKQMAEWHRTKTYMPMGELKTILVFWVSGSDDRPMLKQIHEHFPDLDIDWLCFLPDEVTRVKADDITYIKSDDLGMGKRAISRDLFHLLEKQYDLLLDLTGNRQLPTDYVLSKSQAKCKIGMEKGSDSDDILLAGVTDRMAFVEETAKFLTHITSY